MVRFVQELSNSKKRIVVFIYDAIMAFVSFPIALCVRAGSIDLSSLDLHSFWDFVVIIAICKIILFYLMKLSRGIWRFSSTQDLVLITKATTIGILFALLVLFFWNRLVSIPRSAFIIDWFICIFLLGGGRFAYRIWKEERNYNPSRKNTIIIGAGEAGEQLIRDIKKDPQSNIKVVGILDDDPVKHKRTIHGIPVIGSIEMLPELAEDAAAENVFIAIPSATSKEIRKIVETANEQKLRVLTLPSLSDIMDGKVNFSQLRAVSPEDLLGRQPVDLDLDALGKMLSNKTIMVTGAGGSIGSELCNQILKFAPQKLVLFEICEFFIYQIEHRLNNLFPNIEIVPVVGDVKDRDRLNKTFATHSPQIVFHAAAYKHVPMMEHNPQEAIKNNVLGTKTVAEEAIAAEVERFIMISTDKAVNPTNVMGASKRAAEMICQSLQSKGKTDFITLRFGNVLGSAGSVIPRFIDQIKKGGPVTVTHPEITRYFMSIPEATQLVLQAGTIGNGGEIFVLDMGTPVKIVDLARDLITLSGFKPDTDIEIEFTGLRPGEKLYEELLANDENTLPTAHELVRVAQARANSDNFETLISNLIDSSESEVKERLKDLIPEYTPQRI